MIYKIKIRELDTEKEDFIIMGNSYKRFEDHFRDIVSHFTEKWHYESPQQYTKCLGRTMKVEFLQLWKSKDKFVSFGGLKMAYEENYDSKVEEHNKSDSYPPCKYLKDIKFEMDNTYLAKLIKDNRIIKAIEIKEEKS